MIEPTHRTALQNGIPTLYHYEKFNAEYLATTLRDKILHCSKPANLNDPWDCKPAFDPHSLDEPEALRKLMEGAQPHPAKHLVERRLLTEPAYRVKFIAGQSQSIEKMLAKRRIYCLVPKPDSILMWSHYADKHHGICLEFDVANNMLFREGPRKIEGVN